METISDEVIAAFAVTPRARRLPRRWREDPDQLQVARVVLAHTTKVLYELEPRGIDFARFCADDPVGGAALGNPARQIREHARRQGYPPADVAQAVRWRIGLADRGRRQSTVGRASLIVGPKLVLPHC